MKTQFFLIAAFLFIFPTLSMAQEKLDGWFIASEQCEAFQSFKKSTNPGDIRLEIEGAYEMIGINKSGGEWFQVRIDNAPVTPARWVPIGCGVHVVAAERGKEIGDPGLIGFEPESGIEATDLLIALSWQPAFCEMKPNKTECQQVNQGLLPITENQLSLHGLWPQPRGNDYCGVSQAIENLDKQGRWSELPAPELDNDTKERLAVAMPGTASFLERHEWIKHGTCFFGDRNGDEYYDDTLLVMDAINSAVAELFESHVGGVLSSADIRTAFNDAFGDGAGDRVQVNCKGDGGRTLIQELKISLSGEITDDADVGALILAAPRQSPGCSSGIVDPVGLQ